MYSVVSCLLVAGALAQMALPANAQAIPNAQVAPGFQPVGPGFVMVPTQPVMPQPVVAGYVPRRVTAYSPVAVPYAAPRILRTRTKFFVPGQPLRNVFRGIWPGVPTGRVVGIFPSR